MLSEDCYYEQKRNLENYLKQKGFQKTSKGSSRAIWSKESASYILKVPRFHLTQETNRRERNAWTRSFDHRYAPCRIVHIYQIPVLMMKKVDVIFEPSTYSETSVKKLNSLPYWVYKIDSGQVGRLNGKIVAYDYPDDALNPNGRNQLSHDKIVKRSMKVNKIKTS